MFFIDDKSSIALTTPVPLKHVRLPFAGREPRLECHVTLEKVSALACHATLNLLNVGFDFILSVEQSNTVADTYRSIVLSNFTRRRAKLYR